jgi:hypothetical protein
MNAITKTAAAADEGTAAEGSRNPAAARQDKNKIKIRSHRDDGVQIHFPFRPDACQETYRYMQDASGRRWIAKVVGRLVGIADWRGEGKKVLRLAVQCSY